MIAWRSASSNAPQRLLAAVEVDDRDTLERRGEGGRGGLVPVADEQQGVGPGRPQALADGPQRGRRPRCRRPARSSPRATRAPIGLEAVVADHVERRPVSAPTRCVPPATRRRRTSVCVTDRDARRVEDPPVLAPGREDRDDRTDASRHASPSTSAALDGDARGHRAAASGRRPSDPARAGANPVPGRRTSTSSSLDDAAGRERAPPVEAPPRDAADDRQLRVDRDACRRSPARPRSPHRRDHRRERVGLQRCGVVGPGQPPIERQVLLDQRGAQRRPPPTAKLDPGRVVGPADGHAERALAASRWPAGSRPRARRGSSTRSGTARAAGRRRRATVSTAAATSTMSAIPVDRSSGRPRGARRARNGRFVSSPDADLEGGHVRAGRAGRPTPSSNGVERNTMPALVGVLPERRASSAGRAAAASISRWSSPARRRVAGTRRSGRPATPRPRIEGLELDGVGAGRSRGVDSRRAIARSPSWLTPASAMTNTGPSPIRRSPNGTGRTAAPRAGLRGEQVVLLVDVDARSAGIDSPMVRPGSTNRRDRASSAASTT